MSRRRRAVKREIHPDAKFGSRLVRRLMNIVMQRGKHNLAQRIVYGAFEQMEEKQGGHALEILERAVENIKPRLEVKSRRVGGATYQVPLEVSGDRSEALALRWMVGFAKSRKGTPMRQALAKEILEIERSRAYPPHHILSVTLSQGFLSLFD